MTITTFFLPRTEQNKSVQEEMQALQVLQEYMEVGAVIKNPSGQTRHLIPWFVIQKGEKLRLITDCRELNQFLTPKPFKLESWKEIFPVLIKVI